MKKKEIRMIRGIEDIGRLYSEDTLYFSCYNGQSTIKTKGPITEVNKNGQVWFEQGGRYYNSRFIVEVEYYPTNPPKS